MEVVKIKAATGKNEEGLDVQIQSAYYIQPYYILQMLIYYILMHYKIYFDWQKAINTKSNTVQMRIQTNMS